MNLKDEKFLSGLKAAIESGKGTEYRFEGEHYRVPYYTFDIDESLSAVVKFLEENFSHWTPIEEFELVPGEKYDVFHFLPGYKNGGRRITDIVYRSGQFMTDTVFPMYYAVSEVTHIMKRPADPEN